MRNLPTTAIPGVDWEPDAFADGSLPFVREQKLVECGPDVHSVTEHGILTPSSPLRPRPERHHTPQRTPPLLPG